MTGKIVVGKKTLETSLEFRKLNARKLKFEKMSRKVC